jgi:Arc/MetJ-type ribon-helix-helix transcriptional regulator
VSVRLPRELETKLNAWIERQLKPKPSRSAAVRRLIEKGLDAE